MTSDVRREAEAWFAANWDPDVTLGEWWSRLAESGWGYPAWPLGMYGKGLPGPVTPLVAQARRRAGALGPAGGVAAFLVAPTILQHGSAEQQRRYLADIVTGRALWCQLFSEPGAGSDLANVRTRAARCTDGWTVNGQKMWTSGAHLADYGILLARTDADADKHHGLTMFVIDMRQPGIRVEPIREMTGDAMTNEVFLSDAHVRDDQLVGAVGKGWHVARTTLSHERNMLGAGSMSGSGGMAGARVERPDLSERVGDIALRAGRTPQAGKFGGGSADLIVELARRHGVVHDPLVRQDIARIYSLLRIAQFTSMRAQDTAQLGRAPGAEASIGKLLAGSLSRLSRDAVLRIMGPHGLLAGADETTNGRVERLVLTSPLWSIGGGTDEIQRTVIGEKVLGLPPEPRVDKGIPFKDLKAGRA
jgi:alkylation response protein AidB-like acyl-CoA dehydrogenase